jgi:two-component system sensor histidine kinase DctS
LLGLLALLVVAVISLLVYLNNFEADEVARRRAADAQWLEQSVQFHFRRLEDDLLVLARQAASPTVKQSPGQTLQGGLLWREPGVLLDRGWIAARPPGGAPQAPIRWPADHQAHPENAQALQIM